MFKWSDLLACCSQRDKDINTVPLEDRLKDFNATGDDTKILTEKDLAKLNRYQ